MLIQRDQLIAGRPATEVRDLMRRLRGAAYTVAALADELCIDARAAGDLVDELSAVGLVEPVRTASRFVLGPAETLTNHAAPDGYRTTIAGNALAKARIGKPMPRAKASELLDSVIRRTDEVNSSDDWLHWVTEVQLYGAWRSTETHRLVTSTSRFGSATATRATSTCGCSRR